MNRARITFDRCTIEQFTIDPAEKGPTAVLVLSAPLSKANADLLKCGYLFKSNGDAYEMQEGHSIANMLRDTDLLLPTPSGAWEHIRPEMIWRFKITNEGSGLGVKFRAQCKSNHLDLAEFVLRMNKDTFECALLSAQGEFDFTGSNPGGTAVDMSGPNSRVSDGPLFKQPDEQEPPLASAQQVDGRRKRKPETRQPEPEAVGVGVD